MTTKEYLSQIKDIDRRINVRLKEVYRLRCLCTSISVASDNERVDGGKQGDKLSDTINRIVDMEKEIDAQVDTMLNLKAQITAQIENIPDKEVESILYARYVVGEKFDEIPYMVNVSRTTMFRLHDKGLAMFSEMYGHLYFSEVRKVGTEWD